jgi:hypothetical protein
MAGKTYEALPANIAWVLLQQLEDLLLYGV